MQCGLLGITAALLLALALAQEDPGGTECGECDRSTCSEVGECPGGVVKDACGCCQVCARSLGQRCDLPSSQTSRYGVCGEFLQCRSRTDIGDTEEATCVCEEDGAVCGSDGITYKSLCDLLLKSSQSDTKELFVSVRGPCMAAPVIKSAPENMVRPLGSILVLDCEAVGYPVPEISWQLNRLDGSSIKLPSDDSTYAVQVRGGPEPYMVTGWVQIMRITEESLGVYTCVATNSEGSTKASAAITLEKPGERDGGASNAL